MSLDGRHFQCAYEDPNRPTWSASSALTAVDASVNCALCRIPFGRIHCSRWTWCCHDGCYSRNRFAGDRSKSEHRPKIYSSCRTKHRSSSLSWPRTVDAHDRIPDANDAAMTKVRHNLVQLIRKKNGISGRKIGPPINYEWSWDATRHPLTIQFDKHSKRFTLYFWPNSEDSHIFALI